MRGAGELALLAAAGVTLVLVTCYWNLIALGGPLEVDRWVADLARPIAALHEALAGPLERDAEGLPQVNRIAQLVASWSVGTLAYFAGVWLVLSRPERVSGRGLELIVAVAILCRVIPVFSPPILETDPCRYLWDGASVVAGVNPYRHAPLTVLGYKLGRYRPADAAELATLADLVDRPRLNGAFRNINHATVPTLYPPLAQILFSIAHRIAPGDVVALKALVALLDLLLLGLIAALLDLVGAPRCRLLIYAWCPLVLKEHAQTGHYDPVASVCLLGALFLVLRGRAVLGGIYLGLAALGKLYPLVALPAMLSPLGKRGALACAATIGLFWAPYLGIGAAAFEGLRVYNREWLMNASVFALVRALVERVLAAPVLESIAVTKVALGLALAGFLVHLALRAGDAPRQVVGRSFAAVGALFLLSPVGNPWYCAWVLPFAALSGRVSWVVLSGTMVAYYAYFTHRSYLVAVPALPWPVDLRVLEYAPFYLILLAETLSAARTAPGTSRQPGA